MSEYSFWRGVWWALDATASEYSKTPYGGAWPRIAHNIRVRDGMACRRCQRTDRVLEVHHRWHLADARRYGDFGIVLACMPPLLLTLCPPCHKRAHDPSRWI